MEKRQRTAVVDLEALLRRVVKETEPDSGPLLT